MMSVYEDHGSIVIHLAWQDAWVNMIRMSPDDAMHHADEIASLVRRVKSGLIVEHAPTGLIVPGMGNATTPAG